ncbi:MAG: hypothetical protein GQE15_13760 [Archangiaceae bacterium]|nr:hypothetical protein [Archangiaceae bacterium]
MVQQERLVVSTRTTTAEVHRDENAAIWLTRNALGAGGPLIEHLCIAPSAVFELDVDWQVLHSAPGEERCPARRAFDSLENLSAVRAWGLTPACQQEEDEHHRA